MVFIEKMNSGIYQIRNLIDRKVYIGSTEMFPKRKSDHFSALRSNRHNNSYLQNAFNKHGEENFVFEEIMYCEPKDCLLVEQDYLDCHFDFQGKCYNINPLAIKPPSRKGKKLSKEQCEKMKERRPSMKGKKHSQKAKERMRQKKLGTKQTEEHRKNIAQALTGNKNPMKNPETAKTHKQAVAKFKKPISQYDLDGNWIRDWNSAQDAGGKLNITRSNITATCKGRLSSAGGFIWKYKGGIV